MSQENCTTKKSAQRERLHRSLVGLSQGVRDCVMRSRESLVRRVLYASGARDKSMRSIDYCELFIRVNSQMIKSTYPAS